ncbi:hypothetical protein VTN31DRAFT_3522 [Thermomyces dupontii]|uniref:uncharacterized protein n=1 Tax=Talaromyces thermophilus TaxID=28565 RepID=UPI00374363CC
MTRLTAFGFNLESFDATHIACTAALIISGLWLCRIVFTQLVGNGELPLPPGPRGLPIIGNLHQAPKHNPWVAYRNWSRKYGPLMSLKNGNNIMIIVTSYDIVRNFLEKHNAIFSSRPQLALLNRLTKGLSTAGLPYGPRWKTHRALRTAVLKPSMTVRYREIQDVESRQLLHELLTTTDISKSLRRTAASVFLAVAYGERLDRETPELQDLENVIRHIARVTEACFQGTAMLAEFFPILRYLPGNSKWKREADMLHEHLTQLYVKKLQTALELPAWNWIKEYSMRKESKGMDIIELAHTVGSIYEASLSAYQIVRIIILAAMLYPDETRKAQAEVDRVVGCHELPDWRHMPELRFIDAFIKEAVRWRPFSPLAAPRAATEDITYKGYRIPKGATIVVNQWAMDHDETIFPDPFTFRPGRWIENPNLPHIMFGFGQRECPGRHLGYDTLYITVSRLLWAFNINRPIVNGKEVEMDVPRLMEGANSVSFFSIVPDFETNLVLRDEGRKAVIEEQWENALKDGQELLNRAVPMPN